MADILIQMDMPKTCADCHDADLPIAIAWLGAKCPWVSGIIDPGVYDLLHNRHPKCPLHELPPHGDLIDRDRLLEDGWVLHKEVIRMGGYAIHELPLSNPGIPVIVTASEEDG